MPLLTFEDIEVDIPSTKGIEFTIEDGVLRIQCTNYCGNVSLSKKSSSKEPIVTEKNENVEVSCRQRARRYLSNKTNDNKENRINLEDSLDEKPIPISRKVNDLNHLKVEQKVKKRQKVSFNLQEDDDTTRKVTSESSEEDNKNSLCENSEIPKKCQKTKEMAHEKIEVEGVAPCSRWGHSCTLLDSKKMIIYGGEGDEEVTRGDLFVYDIESRNWSQPLNCDSVPRSWHSKVFLPDKQLLLVFGGEINISGVPEVLSNLMVLDTEVFLWYPPVVSGKPPAARSGHTCSVIGDHVILFGGSRGRKWQNNVAFLNTKEWQWEKISISGTPPKPRSYHSATTVGESIVFFGGNDQSESFNTIHFLADSWQWIHPTPVGTPPCVRTGHTATLLDSTRILILGGWDQQSDSDNKVFRDAFILDTLKWEWKEVTTGSGKGIERVGHTCSLLSSNEKNAKVLVFGGQDGQDRRHGVIEYVEIDF